MSVCVGALQECVFKENHYQFMAKINLLEQEKDKTVILMEGCYWPQASPLLPQIDLFPTDLLNLWHWLTNPCGLINFQSLYYLPLSITLDFRSYDGAVSSSETLATQLTSSWCQYQKDVH
jgi:hypothetical protein